MAKLYVVGTPIGNSKDITLRAIETLHSVSYIACEDTRVTSKLLSILKIEGKKLLSCHEFNEKNSSLGIIKLIEQGNDVALVSDAGMPVISDPGYVVIREAINNGIDIDVIPGPSASTMAVVLSNLNTIYTFVGFLKDKTIQRQNQLLKLNEGTYVAYVSPHKLYQTLKDIKETCGANTKLFLGKELTKMFEKHFRGTVDEVLQQIDEKSIKGEYTMVFEKRGKDE